MSCALILSRLSISSTYIDNTTLIEKSWEWPVGTYQEDKFPLKLKRNRTLPFSSSADSTEKCPYNINECAYECLAMAFGGLVVTLVVVDSLLRRLVLPLILLSAVILRYNLISFVYLLFLVVLFLLPGPRLKSQKVSSIILLVLLLVLSGVAILIQALFQISLETSYKDKLKSPCNGAESIWRQFGFVLFSIPAVDVVRLLLPDLIVFIVSLLTLIIDVFVVIKLKPGDGKNITGASELSLTEDVDVAEVEARPVDSGRGRTDDVLLDHHPPYPKNIQCYWEIHWSVSYVIEFGIFVLLGLSGIAVPSLTSFAYYAVFLALLVIWSIHMRLRVLVRILRSLLTFYSAIHLLMLHLFQFSVAQFYIQNGPCSNTTNCSTTYSLLARLFGLTPIIMTDCSRPTQLLLWRDLNYTVFLSPAFVFILFCLLATDFRMWMFTPKVLWKQKFLYYLPVHDQLPLSSVKLVMKSDSPKSQILVGSKSYGTMGPGGLLQEVDSDADTTSSPDLVAPVLVTPKLSKRIWVKALQFAQSLWTTAFRVSFIFTVVAMMMWGVLYPSWPSLVFLLWSCGIWLIPKLNPNDSVVFTSPLLVFYSVLLLLIQYVYSLDLTTEEFPKNSDVVVECLSGKETGCKSIALFAKTMFTVILFASFREFVRVMKIKVPQWWSKRRHRADGEMLLAALHDDEASDANRDSKIIKSSNATKEAHSQVYASVYRLLCTYWVVVVVGAFLIVMLTGQPSVLKCVYLVCFFLFMVTYQVAERYWFFFCLPVWWLLVFYAAIHLVLVYTYPFRVINNFWMDAYNNTNLMDKNVTATDLFESIGFIEYSDRNIRTLLATLVPPTVFIAVMALQLRFFKPRSLLSTAGIQVSSQTTLDIYSLLPKKVRDTLSKLEELDIVEDSDEENDDDDDDDDDADIEISRGSPSTLSIKSSALRESLPKWLYSCYKLSKYTFIKTRQIIVDLNNIFWRFLELHLHKIIAVVLFATSVSQISAAYFVLLVLILIVVPLPYFIPLLYPVITVYLGLLSTAKMIFNLPIMSEYYLNFSLTGPCKPIIDVETNGTNYSTYYPINDTNWIGLYPAENFANYISLPVVSCLLLSFWFSARRYQARHYKSREIEIHVFEHRSLFLNVTREKAEVSIIASLKYLINHFFEMYGIEVCWAMLAIAVAVRIDVYGVVYAIALGILFLIQRSLLPLVCFLYLLLHGILLVLQYFFLLGAPPSLCYNIQSTNTVYPWSNLTVEHPHAFKKWLFIPDDALQILNSHLLYADFFVYIVVCLQLMLFYRNPLKQPTPKQVDGSTHNFYESQFWIDYIKVFVFQYSFWFSLFLLFFTAAYRISLFGVFYLLVGFYLLYQGQQMLMNRKHTRHRYWAILRFLTWITLMTRVSLQILDCVFWKKINDVVDNCLLILLFNGACTKPDYYGSAVVDCPDEPQNLGLWIDALNFIIITFQIVIFDTRYAEIVREELTRKVDEAQSFKKVFDAKVKQYQEAQNEKKDKELTELVERAEKLAVSEKKIDHLLYAGVRVPDDIQIRPTKNRSSSSSSRNEEEIEFDSPSITSATTRQKIGRGKEKTTARKIYEGFLEVVDWLIEQLEQGSSLYRDVVCSIKESLSPAHARSELEPLSSEIKRYGSTEETSQPAASSAEVTVVEVHGDTQEQADEQQPEGDNKDGKSQNEKQNKKKKKKKSKKTKSVAFADVRGDTLIDELHIEPSESQREEIQQYEDELEKKALKATSRLRRLSTAMYYFLLAHSDYPVFFFIILNIILNGSLLSLVYAILLYTWGLLSIPWPTRKFWLTLIFYTMSVLLIKYAFQFHDIAYWSEKYDQNSGLYPPLVLGILHRKNFFTNAVWDILLLIALLLHRGLLVQYGLWNTDTRQTFVDSFTDFFHHLWLDVKDFFTRLFDPNVSQGAKDYYAVMLFFDILCFLTIAAGINSFGFGIQTKTVEDLTAVADFVRNNNVPLTFVALLLLHFLSMVIDRAIYVRHSLLAKFVFQIVLLIGWHVGLFFVLPSDPLTGRPFTSNAAAQCLYFFKSCYFIASSLQIVSGYPARIIGYLLASSYNTVSWLAFLTYRLIPLLPELRETVDWTFTDTSLSLINWFKVQEIYSLIYLVKVQRTREKSFPRDLGEKQSWIVKIFAGGLLLIGLVLLIWLPLLLISVVGQASEPNPPVEVDIKLSVGGFQPLVQLTVQERGINKLSDTDYEQLRELFNDTDAYPVFSREFDQEDFRRIEFPGQSTALWTISPPSRDLLYQQLIHVRDHNKTIEDTIPIDFLWSIKRAPSSSSNTLETVSGVSTQQLSNSSYTTLEALIASLNSETLEYIPVPFPNLYPKLIRAPSSEQSSNFTQLSRYVTESRSPNVSCTAFLNRTNDTSVEWWSLRQNGDYIVDPMIDHQLEMIIYSERVAPQIFSIISGFGIIGLYVSVVLVIGRFIRTYIADLPYRLAVDEILNPDPLIKLCHDIYTVRESRKLELEEILVGKLFYIFRSSERIVKITEDVKQKTD